MINYYSVRMIILCTFSFCITNCKESLQGVLINRDGLIWPINCKPGDACFLESDGNPIVGYPDIDRDGIAFNCGAPGYAGHEGTDIPIATSNSVDHYYDIMEAGVDVYAAADGEVIWVFDGRYDKCPDSDNLDCKEPIGVNLPDSSHGYRVCTDTGDFCGAGNCCCFWCFDGGNVIVIKHINIPGIFATRYDHLKKNSTLVNPGDAVTQGQKIGEVGSSGKSSGPHLHFEVWGSGFYSPVDPWAGDCGSGSKSLWKYSPPWESN